jgi:DNA repair protein SbcD/Mre11
VLEAVKILHFADLHLGVEAYGHFNPESGLSSRFDDFLASFDRLVDYALENSVDLVLFCGDAYKSRDPSQTQQREFARRIKRLSLSGIPVFLLVGNHDLPGAIGRATTTEIFDTLAVANVYVANKPDVYRVATQHGPIQIVALPWLKRSGLIAREDAKNLDLSQLNQQMRDVLSRVVDDLAAKLDPQVPAVLAAHVWVQGARVGSEDTMTIGQEHSLLLSTVTNSGFDYVALGHIHRQQVLAEHPPVVYAGSLDCLDFGDENTEKGFYMVDVTTEAGNRQTSYRFQPLPGRRFVTLKLKFESDDLTPTESAVALLRQKTADIDGNIVRLELALPEGLAGQVCDRDIREAAAGAYFFTIAKSIARTSRARLDLAQVEAITPVNALEAYLRLKLKDGPAAQLAELVASGKEIIAETISMGGQYD